MTDEGFQPPEPTDSLTAPPAEPGGPVRVAVVIPCKDEVATLAECLQALRSQVPAPFRIIVVDNGSRDGSLEQARTLADVVLEIEGGTIAGLRNEGARQAPDADVLAFVDADVVVAAGWLAEAVNGLRSASLVGSRMDAPEDGTWVQKRWAALEGGAASSQTSVWSGHLAMTADVFNRLGGFDTMLATGEDSDLSERLRALGGTIRQQPGMGAVHHGFPRTVFAMWRRERWHSRTPGFLDRLAPRSRMLVVGASAWAGAGIAAAGWSLLTRSPLVVGGWAGLSAAGVAGLGAMSARSLRHAVPDGVLISVWAAARALRLPREVAFRRRGPDVHPSAGPRTDRAEPSPQTPVTAGDER